MPPTIPVPEPSTAQLQGPGDDENLLWILGLRAIPVVPKMYPHRKSAIWGAEYLGCPDFVDGNSGAPIFVDGQVIGVGSSVHMSPGPKKLQDFIRQHDELRFLLANPTTAPGSR